MDEPVDNMLTDSNFTFQAGKLPHNILLLVILHEKQDICQ
jgi:hypothetical protein